MFMKYRLGWPFGKVVARMGVPTLVRIDVVRDSEAGVYVGTSDDLPGLVLEADTLDELLREAHEMIPSLLDGESRGQVASEIIPSLRYDDRHAAHA